MASNLSLVAQLRRRIKDERVSHTAFRLACKDESASDCIVAISPNFRLTTTVINGRTAPNIDVDLSDFEYDTIRKLSEYLQTLPGYELFLEQDVNPHHPSRDLCVVGSMSIAGQAVPFKHHLFSEDELRDTLEKACTRHNMSYVPETLPENEYEFVLTLASATILRELAKDAAKRRNLDTSVDQLLAIAAQEEQSYKDDVKRQQRVIPTPKFVEDDTGTGDVVVGQLWRRSIRTGYSTPFSAASGPTAPTLELPAPEDVEDTKVTLRWRRNVDYNFYSYELWRDTTPNITRPQSVQRVNDGPNLLRESVKRPFTAKLVYRSFGPTSTRDRIGFATFVEQAGQVVTEFVDTGLDFAGYSDGTLAAPPLEPVTTYYYRLYVQSQNFGIVGSNIVSITTLPLRSLLATPVPLYPVQGTAGTSILVRGLRFSGLLTGSPRGGVTLGGKPVVGLSIVNDTTLTFQVPAFYNPNAGLGSMDLVLTSPVTGLIDVYAQAFRYIP